MLIRLAIILIYFAMGCATGPSTGQPDWQQYQGSSETIKHNGFEGPNMERSFYISSGGESLMDISQKVYGSPDLVEKLRRHNPKLEPVKPLNSNRRVLVDLQHVQVNPKMFKPRFLKEYAANLAAKVDYEGDNQYFKYTVKPLEDMTLKQISRSAFRDSRFWGYIYLWNYNSVKMGQKVKKGSQLVIYAKKHTTVKSLSTFYVIPILEKTYEEKIAAVKSDIKLPQWVIEQKKNFQPSKITKASLIKYRAELALGLKEQLRRNPCRYLFNYDVQSGDNLSGIAHTHLEKAMRWREIYLLNYHTIKNEDLIYPGQDLQIFPPNRPEIKRWPASLDKKCRI